MRSSGFDAVCVDNGAEALRKTQSGVFSALLLDLMLPGVDGMEVCRQVRQYSSLPILMITARVEEIDRLLGLEIGADDYICKPFSPREVVARLRAQLRRAEGRLAGQPGQLAQASGGFSIDETGKRVFYKDQPLNLTQVEFRLLRALVSQPGRVFSRDNLLDHVHADNRDTSDRAVDSHIKNLRRKLQGLVPAGHECIGAVYGVGYRFDPPE